MIRTTKSFATLLFACLMTLSLSSCKKDKLANNLEGEWKVKSLTSDGEELIGTEISSFKIEFEDYDSGDREGDLNWNIVYTDGSSDVISGEYEVDEDSKEVEMTLTESGIPFSYEFDVELDGDDLTLSGNLDGSATVFKAERD
jgi:hypothetical protein